MSKLGYMPGQQTIGQSEEEIVEKSEKVKKRGFQCAIERLSTMKIGVPNDFISKEERNYMKNIILKNDKAFTFVDEEQGRLDPAIVPPAKIHTIQHVPWNDKPPNYA
ncbi:hypothetical protein HK096_009289 [Nowakowskiella sp. JEL0078]|nr:hypothetical protein HK096_009289 [Nowakowskiella sp. JEL0078]